MSTKIPTNKYRLSSIQRARLRDAVNGAEKNARTAQSFCHMELAEGYMEKMFDKQSTMPRYFTTREGTHVQVPTMHINSKFRYNNNWGLNTQFLELPYERGEMSMVFALPGHSTGLPALQSKLATNCNIQEILSIMSPVKVDVRIPKFKIETKIDLKEILPKVGINRIFDEQTSELTKILPDRLFVSKAIQKAFVEVNEEGAEAVAVTAIVMAMGTSLSSTPQIVTFHADRPFAFFLLHTDKVLFTGTVCWHLFSTEIVDLLGLTD